MKTFLLCFFGFLTSLLAEDTLLKLTNTEGKAIQGTLLAKTETVAVVQMGERAFTIPFDQLSEQSVELIQKTNPGPPRSRKFGLNVNIRKRGKTHRSVNSNRLISSSYRIDEVDGKISVTNKHNSLNSRAVTVRIAILIKEDKKPKTLMLKSYQLDSLEPFASKEFDIPLARIRHSEKGTRSTSTGYTYGKYFGYIAAIYEGSKLIALKSVPSTYERDPDKAENFLIDLVTPEIIPQR